MRVIAAMASTMVASLAAGAAEAGGPPGEQLGKVLPAWSALPFVGILLSIALFPLLAPRFWHHHYPKVAAAWGLALAVPFVAAYGTPAAAELLHMALLDYVPFIVLIGTLFVIGGGILVRGTLRGSPWANAAIMATGATLASWIGTTGAAVLLIRPLLRANRQRRRKAHTVVFFIFLVANIGGVLTPLGDPPLFLGFLHGVPFFWSLTLWRELLMVAGLILAAYVALDVHHWKREDAAVRAPSQVPHEPLRVEGWHNFIFLGGVLAAVVLSGVWHPGTVSVLGVDLQTQNLLRDAVLVLLAAGSLATTRRRTREENGYTWGPVREVAILFAGIFATIVPVLLVLRAGEAGALGGVIHGIRTPAQFFWGTGLLSSFLDNAPTYLAFLSTAIGRIEPGAPEREAVLRLVGENHAYLQAIATGAVFMGANTYIGNAPNFMVKSIAEEAGIEMPSFFGYVVRYALPFLVPVFLLATWVFFG
ncbi:MAG: sodium:proton antiporter [Acidobacteria bacterium]|nr:MAG: sodium:proton antiporter [Acidobacteriota bacterium]